MSKPGDVSYTVYYGASEDGYPTSKNFTDKSEAVLWAIDRSKDSYCRPVTVTEHIVIVELTEAFGGDDFYHLIGLPKPTGDIYSGELDESYPVIEPSWETELSARGRELLEQSRCYCGDPGWGNNGSCGISGCSNVPC